MELKMKIVLEINHKIFGKLIKPSLIIIGVLLVIGLAFAAVKANDYWQVKKLVKSSEVLTNQEKYQDAIDKLSLTQNRWTFKIIRQQVNDKAALNKKLLDDQNNFNSGNTLFGESKWEEAKDKYSKVSEKSLHYKEAQDKIKECQSRIDEANAQAEKDKQAVIKTIVNNDPFPSAPDYSSCPPASTEHRTISLSSMTCRADLDVKYEQDKEAWYARHGQTVSQTKNTTKTSCSWNYSWCPGRFGCEWVCTSN